MDKKLSNKLSSFLGKGKENEEQVVLTKKNCFI